MAEPHSQPISNDRVLLERLCKLYWGKGDSGRAAIYQQKTAKIPRLGGSGVSPATYSVIDLDDDLRALFPSHSPRMLLRQEYKDLKTHIHEMQMIPMCMGIVVTGQSGIGKTCFLLYLLIERILNGEVTAWSTSNHTIYLLLGENKVEVHSGTAEGLNALKYPGAWALVDPNEESVWPHFRLTDNLSNFFVVQVALPQAERWDPWFTDRSAELAVMKPWSWEEIFVVGTQLDPSQALSATKLENVFVMYGPSLRQCFEFVRNERKMVEWEQDIPSLLQRCDRLTTVPDSVVLLGGKYCEPLPEPLLSRIFCLVPNELRYPGFTLVSPHIASHLVKEERSGATELQVLCSRFREHAESQDAAEWLEKAQTLPG